MIALAAVLAAILGLVGPRPSPAPRHPHLALAIVGRALDDYSWRDPWLRLVHADDDYQQAANAVERRQLLAFMATLYQPTIGRPRVVA